MPPTEDNETTKQENPSAASATPAPTTTEAAAGNATESDAGEGNAEPRKVKVGDEEFATDERGQIAMPVKAFESRLRRASKKSLEEAFGTSDITAIKKQLARAKELEAKQEEATRAQMSELERIKADLKSRDEKLQETTSQLEQLRAEREFERTDSVVMSTAAKYVDPQYADVAAIKFGQYVRDELTEKEANRLTTKDIAAWFDEYAKEHPALVAKKPREPKEPEARREPLNNGAPERKPTPKPDTTTGSKTAKLGQANSMTDAEWQEFKKKSGFSY